MWARSGSRTWLEQATWWEREGVEVGMGAELKEQMAGLIASVDG
jgi:hypothetical protein